MGTIWTNWKINRFLTFETGETALSFLLFPEKEIKYLIKPGTIIVEIRSTLHMDTVYRPFFQAFRCRYLREVDYLTRDYRQTLTFIIIERGNFNTTIK